MWIVPPERPRGRFSGCPGATPLTGTLRALVCPICRAVSPPRVEGVGGLALGALLLVPKDAGMWSRFDALREAPVDKSVGKQANNRLHRVRFVRKVFLCAHPALYPALIGIENGCFSNENRCPRPCPKPCPLMRWACGNVGGFWGCFCGLRLRSGSQP